MATVSCCVVPVVIVVEYYFAVNGSSSLHVRTRTYDQHHAFPFPVLTDVHVEVDCGQGVNGCVCDVRGGQGEG
jgi:hypothetical protein